MYNSQQIANIIRTQTTLKKVSIKQMLTEIGLGINTLSHLDNGSMPKADNLAKIVDYLGCSVDYLLGRSEIPNPENAVVKTNSGNVVKGINAVDFPVTVSFPESSLDENQRELLELFGKLPYKEKISLMQELIQRTEKS